MAWWLILLIVLGTIGIGVAIGTLAFYVHLRLVKKRKASVLGVLALLYAPGSAEVFSDEDKEKQKLVLEELLAEIRHNRETLTQPVEGELPSLETRVWDTYQSELDKLPLPLRDEVAGLYTDIRMINSLAWLSSELGRQTPDLVRNYQSLGAVIVERLDRIEKGEGVPRPATKETRRAQEEARQVAEEQARKKAELEELLSQSAKAKREAEESRERAKREAEEARKARQAEKAAEQSAKEKAKREAEESRERAKREAEEARKAREVEKAAEQAAREKAKREAEESRERAKREAEEAREAEKAAEEDITVGLYSGRVVLTIMSPVDFGSLRKLEASLRGVPDLRVVTVSGSVDAGTTIVVLVEKPMPLVGLLQGMPPVKQVFKEGEAIQVELKAGQ